MTLPIGNNRIRRSSNAPRATRRAPPLRERRRALVSRGGFTLIELILVMAMLLTVIAVAIPSLSNFFRGRTLDSEARRFLSLTRYGQSRAVSEGVPMILWLDTKAGGYGLEQAPGYSDGDTKAVSFDLDKDLSIEVVNSSVPSRALVPLPQSGQTRQIGRAAAAIRFQPDGFIAESSPQSVAIREGDGRKVKDEVRITQSPNRLNYEIQSNVVQRAYR